MQVAVIVVGMIKTILSADYVVDLGPGAGIRRYCCGQRNAKEIENVPGLTTDYLKGIRNIEIKKPKGKREFFPDRRGRGNNLKMFQRNFHWENLFA
jgi:excinuclease UvrABC ATPase subunit